MDKKEFEKYTGTPTRESNCKILFKCNLDAPTICRHRKLTLAKPNAADCIYYKASNGECTSGPARSDEIVKMVQA